MRTTNSRPALLLFVLSITAGCAGDNASSAKEGTEGGRCYGNESCDKGLSCLSHLCVKESSATKTEPAEAGEDASDSTSGSSGSGGGNTRATSGNGGSDSRGTSGNNG